MYMEKQWWNGGVTLKNNYKINFKTVFECKHETKMMTFLWI